MFLGYCNEKGFFNLLFIFHLRNHQCNYACIARKFAWKSQKTLWHPCQDLWHQRPCRLRWERRSPGPRTRRSISPSKWSRFCCRTTRRASVFRQEILKPSDIYSPSVELQMCPNCRPTSTWLAWTSHSRCAPTPNTCRRRARSPSSRPGSLSSRRWTQSSPSSTRRSVRVRFLVENLSTVVNQ